MSTTVSNDVWTSILTRLDHLESKDAARQAKTERMESLEALFQPRSAVIAHIALSKLGYLFDAHPL